MKRQVTLRCRIARARFGLLDRLRILCTGTVWIVLANAKEHTRVTATTRIPVDVKHRDRVPQVPAATVTSESVN